MGTITIKDGNDIYYPGRLPYLARLGGFLRRERPTVEGRASNCLSVKPRFIAEACAGLSDGSSPSRKAPKLPLAICWRRSTQGGCQSAPAPCAVVNHQVAGRHTVLHRAADSW